MSSDLKREIDSIRKKVNKIAQRGKDAFVDYSGYVDDLISRGQWDSLLQCLLYYYNIDTTSYVDVADMKKKTFPDICFATKSGFLEKLSVLYKKKKVSQSSTEIYSYDPLLTECQLTGPLTATFSNSSATASILFDVVSDRIAVEILSEDIYRISISKAKWQNQIPEKIETFQVVDASGVTFSFTEIPVTFTGEYLVETEQRNPYFKWNYKLEVIKINLLGSIREIDVSTQKPDYLVYQKPVARFYGDFNTYLEVTKFGATESTIIDWFDPKLSDDSNLIKRYTIALDYLLS